MPNKIPGMIPLVFNLAGIHDVNTGVILTALAIAYLKSRSLRIHAALGLISLGVFMLSILPTPLHGTGIWGIAALLTTYLYLYRVWGLNSEVTYLVVTAILFMMLNILLGFRLRGIF